MRCAREDGAAGAGQRGEAASRLWLRGDLVFGDHFLMRQIGCVLVTSSFLSGRCSGIGMCRRLCAETSYHAFCCGAQGQAGEVGEQGGIIKAMLEVSPWAWGSESGYVAPPAAGMASIVASTAGAGCRHLQGTADGFEDQWEQGRGSCGSLMAGWLGTGIGYQPCVCHGVHHAWGACKER